MTMEKAIERYFNVSLYLLVLTGFGALASTGGLDFPTVILVGLALALRGYQLLTRFEFVITERWTTVLTLIYVFVGLADYFFLSRSFLATTVHLALFLIVVRLFSLQKTRDHYMLAALSFLMILAAAVLTVGSIFLLSFAGFLLVAVVTFVLMEMRHSVSAETAHAQDPRETNSGQPAPYRRMAYGLLAIAPALMLMILAGSFLIFFMIPRVSSRYLSAYTPNSDVSTGFSDRVQLGRIGQIQQSNAVVMHVEIENDLQGGYDLKWRGIALSSFDGRVWSNAFDQMQIRPSPDGKYHLSPLRSPNAPAGHSIRYRVLMEPLGTNVFFLADMPQSLIGNYHVVTRDSGGAIYNLDSEHPINRYEAEAQLSEPDSDELRLASNLVPRTMEPYLKLPDAQPLDPRIPKLAEDITVNATSNYDKAVAVERYLSTHFGYTLELPRTPPENPLANFLFERKKGHCEYFASSMAVMLRSLRIPSRIVTGFRGGEFNDLTGQYVVRASDAHSWVEAYFPGSGWVSFDPTPAGSVPTRTGWSRMQLYIDAAASFWREWIINYDVSHQRTLGKNAVTNSRQFLDNARRWLGQQHRNLLHSARHAHRHITDFPAQWLGGAAAFAALLLALFNLRRIIHGIRAYRLRAHPARAPSAAATLWYERMVARLAKRGWRKLPSQTPLDFVAAIQEELLQMRVGQFTRAYESARFGQSQEEAEKLPKLFEEIAATESAPKEAEDLVAR